MRREALTPKGKVTAKSTESKTLLADNQNRAFAVVTNSGAKDAWIAYGVTAVAEEGVYLKKEGGGHVIETYSGPVSVITKEGESAITYVEV